ncbi:MAG: hypothetical protein R3A52_31595 [Polyangiales bacterium]
MTYATVHRLTRRRDPAVGAAYALVTGPPWLLGHHRLPVRACGRAASLSPRCTPASALSSTLLDGRRPLRRLAGAAAASSPVASLALGSHVIAGPSWVAVGASFVLAPTRRDRAVHPLAFALASTPAIVLMREVNRVRFGAPSLFSYGPCNAQNCAGAMGQSLDAYLQTLSTLGGFLAVVGALLWLSRRSVVATVAIAGSAVMVATVADLPDRFALRHAVRALYGYVIDLGMLDIANFTRPGGAPGNVHNGWCMRALLECSPIFAAALMAHRGLGDGPERSARRATWFAAAGACVGLLLAGTLRGREWSSAVWGNPFLNVRYLTILAPTATVLAALAVESLPWSRVHVALWAVGGALGAWSLGAQPDDAPGPRRVVTHLVPVLLAMALVALLGAQARDPAERARRPARALSHLAAAVAALCLAYGTAVTFGIDLRAVIAVRGAHDGLSAELQRVPERRFLLMGGYAMDHALAVHDRRDVRIVNLGLDPTPHLRSEARVRRWLAEGGVAYLLQDGPGGPWGLPWSGVAVTLVPGTTRVYRVTFAR